MNTCTEIECDSLIAKAVTDEERSLGQREKLKFIGNGRNKENPWLDKLKLLFVTMREVFPDMCRLSTKDDANWHALDIENAPAEPEYGVSVWRERLTVPVCKARMEHYVNANLEEYPMSVLSDFQEVFNAYNTTFTTNYIAKRKEENTAKFGRGRPRGRVGGSTTKSVLQTGTLEVVSLSLRSLFC